MPRYCPHCGYEASGWEANQPVCPVCGRLKYTIGGCLWKAIVIIVILWILSLIL